jgi:transketolase
VLRSSDEDDVAIVAAGITVREALAAADRLGKDGIAARVIDLYSLAPVDVETLAAAAEATQGRIVTVEDHWPEGGLGDAVLAALTDSEEPPRVVKLAVRGMPSSGKPEELLAAAGIDAEHIAAAARRLVAQTVQTA